MKYVIDASVVFQWEVPELLSPKALQLRDDYRNRLHELLAPHLFQTEIANTLLVVERRGRILHRTFPVARISRKNESPAAGR
jgi:hypothetical protein